MTRIATNLQLITDDNGDFAGFKRTDTGAENLVPRGNAVGTTHVVLGVTDVRVNAIQAIASVTNTNVTWHEAVEDALGAWSAGDPTKITVPAGADAMRVFAHLEWTIAVAPDPTLGELASYRSARVGVNGASPVYPYTSGADVRSAVGTISDHQSVVIPFSRCTPGDYLTLIARHNDAKTPVVNIMNTSAVRFMVEWLKAA